MTVKEASEKLSVSEQTMRICLQNDRFGFCVKGSGDKYIYFVDENKVNDFLNGKGDKE